LLGQAARAFSFALAWALVVRFTNNVVVILASGVRQRKLLRNREKIN